VRARAYPLCFVLLAACAAAPPEAISLDGRPLFPPPLAEPVRSERLARLQEARSAYDLRPGELDAIVWLGRRTAYLGRYREAIDIYTEGLALHPDAPELLRHRGHRYITMRQFDRAIADLARAAELIADRPDEVEPDGLPNARGIPTGTLHFNVWYHLGLARFLHSDFAGAARAYASALRVSHHPDALCATTHWYWMTLRRLHRDAEAQALLAPVRADLDVIENHAYHRLLSMYRGERSADEVLAASGGGGDGVQDAALLFGVAHWHMVHGDAERARALFERIVQGGEWAAFGYIAAEVELYGR
jgi:tetratricopeptide (TPR) repeat protein